MSNEQLAAEVGDQFRRALTMFRDAVEAFPAADWRCSDVLYQCPAGLALHIVETIEFYVSGRTAGEFPWGHRFAVDWQHQDSSQLPSQDAVQDYLDETQEELDRWLAETDLLGPQTAFPWTGNTVAGLAMYVLRHIQHHASELSLELTRLGHKAPDWR